MRRGGAILAAVCFFGAALGLPACAWAQWMWKDDQGHTVISDQPPPTSVPQARILRTPTNRPVGPSAGDSDAEKTKSLADQDLEFKKRQKELADAYKKQQDDAAKDQANQQRCASLRNNLTALQSGQRIARTDDQGNRYFVDDAQRQADTQKIQSDMAANCK